MSVRATRRRCCSLSAESETVERLMISPSRLVESAEDMIRAYANRGRGE